jgi:hypothetical protein
VGTQRADLKIGHYNGVWWLGFFGRGEFADAGDFENGAFAAFGGFAGDEAAAGGDVFVCERFEFGDGGVDFDGFYGVRFGGEFGVELDGPASGFAADGHGSSEFAGDGDGLGGLGVGGGLRKCAGDGEEKKREKEERFGFHVCGL